MDDACVSLDVGEGVIVEEIGDVASPDLGAEVVAVDGALLVGVFGGTEQLTSVNKSVEPVEGGLDLAENDYQPLDIRSTAKISDI
ncbi:unnamed protein product [Sphagnum balticum]